MTKNTNINKNRKFENLDYGSVGLPRSGKTERLKMISYEYPCVFYYDVNEDISGERSFYKLPEGTIVTKSIRKMLYEYRVNKKKRIVYIPKHKESIEEFNRWLHYCYKIGKIRYKKDKKIVTVIFVDEIWQFVTQHNIPIKLQELLREGRKYNIVLFWTAQRLARMHSDIQTLTDRLYVFNLIAQDVKRLKEMTDLIDKPLLRSLEKFESILYDINNEKFYKVDTDGVETEIRLSQNTQIQKGGMEPETNATSGNSNGDSKKAKDK